MNKQFFYIRKVQNQPVESGAEPTFTEYEDSFNTDLVIRTMELQEGKRLIVLNDFHEEVRQAPILNKQGKYTGMKNEKNTYQSEITLEKECTKRFINLMKSLVL